MASESILTSVNLCLCITVVLNSFETAILLLLLPSWPRAAIQRLGSQPAASGRGYVLFYSQKGNWYRLGDGIGDILRTHLLALRNPAEVERVVTDTAAGS